MLYQIFGELVSGRSNHKACNGRGFSIIWLPNYDMVADLSVCRCADRYEGMEQLIHARWEELRILLNERANNRS